MVLAPVRFLTKIPSFVFRKLLHILAFSSFAVVVLSAREWRGATILAILIAVLIFPILSLLENEPWYERLFVQKSKGEIKRSMLMLFFMYAALIAVGWGIFGKPGVVACAILMWGVGDAAAALVGIPFGKHKVKLRGTDGKKSWEGSAAMLIVSFAAGLCMLLILQETGIPKGLLTAGLGALFGTLTELFSPSEWDTVTVPTAITAVLLLMIQG